MTQLVINFKLVINFNTPGVKVLYLILTVG